VFLLLHHLHLLVVLLMLLLLLGLLGGAHRSIDAIGRIDIGNGTNPLGIHTVACLEGIHIAGLVLHCLK